MFQADSGSGLGGLIRKKSKQRLCLDFLFKPQMYKNDILVSIMTRSNTMRKTAIFEDVVSIMTKISN